MIADVSISNVDHQGNELTFTCVNIGITVLPDIIVHQISSYS